MGLPSAAAAMIATNAIFMGLAIISVGVRVYVRLRHNPPLFIDDYLIFAALVSCRGNILRTNADTPLDLLSCARSDKHHRRSSGWFRLFVHIVGTIHAIALLQGQSQLSMQTSQCRNKWPRRLSKDQSTDRSYHRPSSLSNSSTPSP